MKGLTEEQYNIISNVKNDKKVTHRQEVIETVNHVTGEVLSSTVTDVSTVTSKEPNFIKLYYRTMLAFCNIDDINVNFVLALSEHISFSIDGEQMHFNNIKDVRQKICARCGIKETMYKTYLARCKDHGLLIPREGMRGSYIVNPFFIARGYWDSIKQLQAEFDFINGKWVYTARRRENEMEG